MNKKVIAALLLLPLTGGIALAEGDYNIGIGAEYSSGDYGTGSTATLWSLPLSLNYRADKWGWGITVPYLILNSSGNVVVGSSGLISASQGGASAGGGGMGSGTTASKTTTESGMGDVTLRGSVDLTEEGDVMPWIGLTLKAKIATADETRYLGTGENDYAAQIEMAKGSVDGYLGYKVLGDPAYVNFNNVAYGALGYTLKSGEKNRYTIEGYVEQPSVEGNDPKREVSLIIDHKLDNDRNFSTYLMKGFSDASPDWGAGLKLKYWL